MFNSLKQTQIVIGRQLNIARYMKPAGTCVFIVDNRLKKQALKLQKNLTTAGWKCQSIYVRAGESLKSIENFYPLYGKLLKANLRRDGVLFAVGGGSVGDAAGFLASTYLRGIAWVGVPTTLLAQVDSSIGGKTAINHSAGKNLIGTFHQPKFVFCDLDFLNSLSKREMISGFGEIVKYAIAFDKSFFRYLVKNYSLFLKRNSKVLAKCISRCLQLKADVVCQDEFDRKGAREVLNLGHTFGHALESVTHYKTFQHGEAVIWGLRFALALSEVRGHLTPIRSLEIQEFLVSLDVPELPNIKRVKFSSYFKIMKTDKKVRSGRIHFVLIQDLGKTISDNQVTEKHLLAAWKKISSS